MIRWISLVLTGCLMGCLLLPASGLAADLAVLPGLKGVFTGEYPTDIGLTEGHLQPCPQTPNCVVSQGADEAHSIMPLRYKTDRETARETLLAILQKQSRTDVVQQTPDYIAVEFTSRLMGFVDDAEFYFPLDEAVIHVRSAARLGESDLGVNRRRIEQFRFAMSALGV
ncbi:MAG: DUF1499 domain-containing protein [Cyanobacteria bacterium P01_A01_bin.105]